MWLSAEKLVLVLLHLSKLGFRLEVVTFAVAFSFFALYTTVACQQSFIFDAQLQMLLSEQWYWQALFYIHNTNIRAEKSTAVFRFIQENEPWNAFKTQCWYLYAARLDITEMISEQEDKVKELDDSNASVRDRKDARAKQKRMEITETNINTFPFLLCIFMPIRVFICVVAYAACYVVQWHAKRHTDAVLERMRDERDKKYDEYHRIYGSSD